MQRRKLTLLLISLILIISLGTWIFLAYKFEENINKARNLSEQYKDYLSYKIVDINKYTFTVTLENYKVHSPVLVCETDQIIVRHFPVINHTDIKTLGKVRFMDPKTDEEIVYLDSGNGNYGYTFSQPMFATNLQNFTIKSYADGKLTYIDSKTNEPVAQLNDTNYTVYHSVSESKKVKLDVDFKYTINFIDSAKLGKIFGSYLPEDASQNQDSLKLGKVLFKKTYDDLAKNFNKMLYPATYTYSLNTEYPHAIYDLAVEAYQSLDNKDALLDLDKKLAELAIKEDMNLQVKYLESNNHFKFDADIALEKKNDDLHIKVSSDSHLNAPTSFTKLVIDAFYPTVNQIVKEASPNLIITKQELEGLIKPFFGEKLGSTVDFKLNLKQVTGELYFDVVATDPDFKVKVDAKGDKDSITGNIFLAKPKAFSNDVVDYVTLQVIPIMQKIETKGAFKPTNVAELKNAINEFISLLNKNKDNNDENLEVDFDSNSPENGFRINGKDSLSIESAPQFTNLLEQFKIFALSTVEKEPKSKPLPEMKNQLPNSDSSKKTKH